MPSPLLLLQLLSSISFDTTAFTAGCGPNWALTSYVVIKLQRTALKQRDHQQWPAVASCATQLRANSLLLGACVRVSIAHHPSGIAAFSCWSLALSQELSQVELIK
jgi:hypothetical protein